MARYLNDREACLREVMDFYRVPRDAAKNCFIVHCHGGGMDGGENKGWMNTWKIADEIRIKVSHNGHLALIDKFKEDCDRICNHLLQQFPEFEDLIEQINQRLPNNQKKQGRMRGFSALSWLMATFEDNLLKHLEEYLQRKGFQVDSLEFDGLKPRREGRTGAFPENVLRDAERHLCLTRVRQ